MSCGVGHRWGSDPVLLLLWLWHRPGATALIKPLAWETPSAAGVALKTKQNKTEHTHHPNKKGNIFISQMIPSIPSLPFPNTSKGSISVFHNQQEILHLLRRHANRIIQYVIAVHMFDCFCKTEFYQSHSYIS